MWFKFDSCNLFYFISFFNVWCFSCEGILSYDPHWSCSRFDVCVSPNPNLDRHDFKIRSLMCLRNCSYLRFLNLIYLLLPIKKSCLVLRGWLAISQNEQEQIFPIINKKIPSYKISQHKKLWFIFFRSKPQKIKNNFFLAKCKSIDDNLVEFKMVVPVFHLLMEIK